MVKIVYGRVDRRSDLAGVQNIDRARHGRSSDTRDWMGVSAVVAEVGKRSQLDQRTVVAATTVMSCSAI